MATTLNSLDNIISQTTGKGNWPVWWSGVPAGATTAATATCGYVTAQRFNNPIVMPSMGSGVTGAWLTYCRMSSAASTTTCMAGLEYLLGTLTVSGNSYSDGVAMPTKTVKGTSVTTAASAIFAVVTTTMTATTPVLTINYTNQAGTTGRSCTITLPTNAAAGSAFLITPHLQSGDTGIRDLSASAPNGLSISTGSAGVIKLYGVLPLSESASNFTDVPYTPDPLTVPQVPILCEAAESVGFYRFGNTAQVIMRAALNFVPSD